MTTKSTDAYVGGLRDLALRAFPDESRARRETEVVKRFTLGVRNMELYSKFVHFGKSYNRHLNGFRKPTSREMTEKSATTRALWGNWARLWLDNGSLFLVGGADNPWQLVMTRTKVHDTINDIHSQLGHAGQHKMRAAKETDKPDDRKILSTFVERESPHSWDDHLSQCLLACRTTVRGSTGFSPALLQLGRELRLLTDIHLLFIPTEAINMGEYT
ncbi:unnamed protein product [Schistocephalus solidus]|uniref:Uncharacterized protein n=1 Tax=Schistocephalus solidus TaxID=70667 RepID=A0A3P7EZY4_SCHSO|nr:unnamed protein product [Schistocephalus solidus]